MTTARDVVEGSLRKIGVYAAGQSVSAEDADDTLTALNDMMHGLEMDGVWLGHTTLALNDTVNLPDSHIEGLKAMLAVRVAPEYEREASQTTIRQADTALASLQMHYAKKVEMIFDRSLRAMPSQKSEF